MISKKALNTPSSGIRLMYNAAVKYENVLNFCIGEPGFQTPEHIVEAARKALLEGCTKYTHNAGVLKLRQAIADKLKRDNHLDVDPEKNIICTTGAGEAILLALLTLADPGDDVLIPAPGWTNYYGHLGIAGLNNVTVKTKEEDRFCPRAQAIEEAITEKSRVLILNTPANPTGTVIPESELYEIAKIAEKYDLAVLADEPYEKFIYDGQKHVSFASLPKMAARTVTINSFSKTYCMTGWRVGYASGPEEVIRGMIKFQENVSSCVNAAAQQGAVAALAGPQDEIKTMKAAYETCRNLLTDGLNHIAGFSCIKPQGAFYVFANIEEMGMDSLSAAMMILDRTRVTMAPGSSFGKDGEGFLRISFCADREDIEEMLLRLEKEFGRK